MHMRLIIVAFVVIAFASLALGATTKATTKKPGTTKAGATTKKAAAKTTTKKPIQCNCTNALLSIWSCIGQDSQQANMIKFWEYQELYNMTGMTSLLTSLKTSGCIDAKAWTDVQGWIKLFTPPTCFKNIINALTAAQKNALKAYADETVDDPKIDAAAEKVFTVIDNKVAKFNAANNKTYSDWYNKYWDTCEEFYELEWEYEMEYYYPSYYSSSN